jgi:hypothetical protein
VPVEPAGALDSPCDGVAALRAGDAASDATAADADAAAPLGDGLDAAPHAATVKPMTRATLARRRLGCMRTSGIDCVPRRTGLTGAPQRAAA